MNIEIHAPRLLVVEGKDDQSFFEALIEDAGLPGFQVLPIGGKTMLRGYLKALTRLPKFGSLVTHLVVVRDADDNPQGAFQSVCGSLRDADLPVPDSPYVLQGRPNSPVVAIVILPGDTPGALEDICLESVRDHRIMPCIDEFFDCLGGIGGQRATHLSKARVQVFLASKPEPGKRLGEAARAGYWPWDAEVFTRIRDFLASIATV